MKRLVLFVSSLMLAVFLWQCKLQRVGEVESVREADDALKVAVNYIGDTACLHYWKDKGNVHKGYEVVAHNKSMTRQLVTHMLNGPNGELISEEYRASAPHRKHLLLSGDRFFAKMRSKNSPLDMQTIADNCRRLVLSVDSDSPPTIIFAQGFALKNQKQELAKMAQVIFGELECLDDQPFCSFKCVANPNAVCPTSKRYFALIWPDKETKQVKALVHWEDLRKRDNSNITIPHLTYTNNPPAMWQRPARRLPPPDTTNPSVPGGEETDPTQPAKPALPTNEEEPATPSVQTSKVFTAGDLASVTISEAKLLGNQYNDAELTLQFTAHQYMYEGYGGAAKVAVASLNSYKFAVNPADFSAPVDLRGPAFYSGNRFLEMRVLDKYWIVGEKLVMKFIVRLGSQGSASFKVKLRKSGFFSNWQMFKDDDGKELLVVVPK